MDRSSRSRSKTSAPRSKRSRSRHKRNRKSRSKSRDCDRRSRRERDHRGSRVRTRSPASPPYRQSLETIVSRLKVLEERSRVIATPENTSTATDVSTATTERIVEAIQSLKSVSTHHFYISNFDPSVHDVDQWFDEVDRALVLNKWSQNECLSRVGNCLKGDAKTWLGEWVTNDRSWNNFKKDFRSLCVKKIDVANILYEVMSSNSDSYSTYAEYARRCLLRLRIVKGLSNELMVAIVIRGIKDPQIKATATNANLTPDNLVSYLSTFVKPTSKQNDSKCNKSPQKNNFKRSFRSQGSKCFSCGQTGHKQAGCPKQSKSNTRDQIKPESVKPESIKPESNPSTNKTVCAYCKKTGHDISVCFAKQFR